MEKAVHLLISGRVQGVSFRYYTSHKAIELGVDGWVRNLMDGKVEAWVQGDAGLVEKMVRWCHQGPPSARVDEVIMEDRELDLDLDGFQIRRTALW